MTRIKQYKEDSSTGLSSISQGRPLSENQKLSFFSMECHGSSGKPFQQVIWEIPSWGIADDVGY